MISHPCAPTTMQEKNQIQVSRGSRFPLSRSTYQVFFTSRFLQIKAPSLVIDTSMKTTWRKSSSWKLWKDCWKPTRGSGLKSRAGMTGEYFFSHFQTLTNASRFIKHLDVDWNFLLFLRQRYDNHVDLPEVWYMHLVLSFQPPFCAVF